MADYWKSQARKFCDFCKCWIADNKPSVQYHENGKRHKENVAKKLSTLCKKSAKQYKENTKLDAEMKKMEEDAVKAYMKDMESNADYTSQVLNERKRQREGRMKTEEGEVSLKVEKLPEKRVWYEGKSPEGHLYYWNSETSESRWEPPEGSEGYVSLQEQEKAAKIKEKEKEVQDKEKDEEVRAWKEREKMKKIRKEREAATAIETESEGAKRKGGAGVVHSKNVPIQGPAPKVDPYGAWSTVVHKRPKPIDLQLPKQEFVEIKVPSLREPSRISMKEKTISSLEDCGAPCSFKKRKYNHAKSNMRQRLSDDDQN